MHISFAEGLLIAIAVGQLLYAALTYHQDRDRAAAENRPQKRPILIIASLMLLTWAAVGYDIYSRPPLPEAVFVNYGVDGPKQFHGIAQLTHWESYKNYKAILITRTIYADRDRLSDDWIAKSIPYTIEGPIMTMVAITENQMHFTAGLTNYIEYNFAVLPAEIAPGQIRNLGDVSRLGGKVLAVNQQGIPIPNQAAPEAPAK